MSYLSDNQVKVLGADVFISQKSMPIEETPLPGFKLKFIYNRGAKVWPGATPTAELTDVYMCRYLSDKPVSHSEILDLLKALESKGFEWVHVEKLLELNSKPAFFT